MLTVGKMEALTRIGFAARGIMYFLIGFLALQSGRASEGSGVLEYLNSGAGKLLLALMAAGFVGYAIWRLSEAVIDSEGHGSDAKGMLVRAGGVVSGLLHLGLGFIALNLAFGSGGGESGGGGPAEQGAATALAIPGGWIAMTLAAAALVVTGLYQLLKAARADFLRNLDPAAAARGWVKGIGRAGYAARGLVFLVMGWFLWQSARDAEAAQAGGMADVLAALPSLLQAVVAAGLLLFGIFSFVEARYRRINDPHVLERLKGAARPATAG